MVIGLFRVFIILFIITFSYSNQKIIKKFEARVDSSSSNLAKKLHPKSHINIFIPSIPYSYVSKSVNAGLIRSYPNKQGWVYDLAKDIKRVDDFTYIVTLRDKLKFQDGSPFTIDDAIYNLEFFRKYPLKYTNIDKIDFDIIKIDENCFQLLLKQKYEMFLTDLARVYFYKKEYIQKYKPKGEETGSANEVAGTYAMGPYILKSGYAVGSKQTDKIELVANPYYWNKNYPKINKITIYTQLDINKAIDDITNYEGKLDIVPIPFNKKLEVLLSPYAKLLVSNSTNNFLIFFNLINGNKNLQNVEVRRALNQALNQENLLNFVYKKEGKISPFATSINYDIVTKVFEKYPLKEKKIPQKKLKELLDGLSLKVFIQDRFMFLFKGIEYQLQKYGVKFDYTITRSEKDIYKQLLSTKANRNTKEWDLLIWGDDDWYFQNPWTVFFTYESNSPWSTFPNDKIMQKNIEKFFKTKIDTKEYEEVVKNILYRAKNQAYNLVVPSPNQVIAVNKELTYKPYLGGIMPLWEIEVSKNHWSIRGDKKYDKKLKKAVMPKRFNDENNK